MSNRLCFYEKNNLSEHDRLVNKNKVNDRNSTYEKVIIDSNI